MSKSPNKRIAAVRITEVVQVIRSRTIKLEIDDNIAKGEYSLDNGDSEVLESITKSVREDYSTAEDMTEVILSAYVSQ